MDTPHPYIWLTVILFLIFLNVFFSLAETALNESHKSRLEKLSDEGSSDAKAALILLENPERANAVIQIGITFMGILLGVASCIILAPMLRPYVSLLPYADILSLGISIVITTCLTLMLSEFLPSRIARQHPEQTLIHCQGTLHRLISLANPLVLVFSTVARGILALFGLNLTVKDTITEDEVKELIEQATEDGTVQKTEQDMVDRVFHLGDQTAYSLMTPRTQILWLDLADSLERNLELIQSLEETFVPVGRESLDDFCGIIYIKDLLNASLQNQPLELEQLIRKPVFIPRSMETFRILEQLQETGVHEAAVLDEYGGVIGFVTMSDILTELLEDSGNIHEPEPMQITPKDDNSWYIDGLCDIDDFKEKFDIDELPDEEQDHYQTMGGFVTALFGYIPEQGERVSWQDFSFEVVKLDRYRLEKIICTRTPAESGEENK